MKEKYHWQTRYVVTDEGRLTHPWRCQRWWTLNDTFLTPEEAVERLELFYANSELLDSAEEEHHILEKVYVKTWE